MSKISTLSILASFFGLWLTSFMKNETQIIVGFILIFSFGIVHGANDLLLIKKINGEKLTTYWTTLINYVAIVLIIIILFSFIPWLAMFLFIIISSYHFGEQHWEKNTIQRAKILDKLFYFIYGLFILLLLFRFHENEVIKIVEGITQITLSQNSISLSLNGTGLILIVMFIYNYFSSKIVQETIFLELLYLMVFTIIFKQYLIFYVKNFNFINLSKLFWIMAYILHEK